MVFINIDDFNYFTSMLHLQLLKKSFHKDLQVPVIDLSGIGRSEG